MRSALTVIVVAQFLGTSLWFTANAVVQGLAASWGIGPAELGHLTSAIQLGFITGTMAFALSGLADRWAASRIFLVCAIAGALANAAFAFAGGLGEGLIWRFVTGLCLAGIYPVGMKLVAGWAPEQKGLALGWLVIGVLVIWGLAVSADSPQFSAMAAEAAPSQAVGSSLAVMNSIGFLITVFAIELTAGLWQNLGAGVTWLLVAGPVLGLLAMRPLLRPEPSRIDHRADGD